MNLKARLRALEKQRPATSEPLRYVATIVGRGPANLANSSCTRHWCNGRLLEVVTLDGSMEHLTEEDLDRFVQSFRYGLQRNATDNAP